MESLLLEVVVPDGVEAVELGGAVGSFAVGFVEGKEEIEAEDFFAEVALVQVGTEDGFVEGLELAERELGREELEADGFVAEFATQALEGGMKDLSVIKGEGGYLADGEPLGIIGVRICLGAMVGGFGECVVGHADDAFARIAVHGAEGVELLEEDFFQASFFGKLAAGSGLQGFFHTDKATWQCPMTFEGSDTALDQQHLKFGVIKAENDAVHGEGGAWVLVGVLHGSMKV